MEVQTKHWLNQKTCLNMRVFDVISLHLLVSWHLKTFGHEAGVCKTSIFTYQFWRYFDENDHFLFERFHKMSRKKWAINWCIMLSIGAGTASPSPISAYRCSWEYRRTFPSNLTILKNDFCEISSLGEETPWIPGVLASSPSKTAVFQKWAPPLGSRHHPLFHTCDVAECGRLGASTPFWPATRCWSKLKECCVWWHIVSQFWRCQSLVA